MVGKYKNISLWRVALTVIPLLAITFLLAGGQTSADILKSPNYQLQPTVGNNFGGSVGSSNYKLTDSGGEAAIGNGAGGSYKIGAGFVAELQHSINLYVEPTGLVAYYPMNEGSGPTVHDASANSNDGTTSGSPTWVDGQIGKALDFNGTSDSVTVPDSPALDPTTHFTIAAWINPASLANNTNYNIFSKENNANKQGYRLLLAGFGASANTNTLDFAVGNGSTSFTYGTAGSVPVNKWSYVVGVFDSGTMKLYLNSGSPVINTGAASSVNNIAGNATIGRENNSGEYFSGSIDDVKIYNRALSSDEVEANYEAGLAGLNSGLVIPAIKAGNSQTVGADVIVSADAPYSLLTNETSLLTLVNGSATIPSIGGTIASPAAWQEGTTQGLGFTVLNGPSASPPPGKWGSGADYAAVPADATSFYNRSGFTGGAKDTIQLQYRLDVSGAQAAGQYKNDVVYTATETP